MFTTTTANFVHGIFAMGSFSAALASLIISIRLGALHFIKDNLINGLMTDVWEGFFLSPINLISILYLFYLPVHCIKNKTPLTIQIFTSILGFPSFLFFGAVFLETCLVLIPLGLTVFYLCLFGLTEFKLSLTNFKLKPSIKFSHQNHKTSQIQPSTEETDIMHFNSTTSVGSNNQQAFPSLTVTHKIHSSSSIKSKNSTISKRKRRES